MASRDLTQGAVPRLLITLALPVMATFVIQALYALVNLFFVGFLGGKAVAAISISLNTFFLVLALGQALGTGSLAMLAQAYGRGERDRVPAMFQQTVWLTLAMGMAFAAAGSALSGPYIRAFSDDPDVIREGMAFFRVYSFTFFTQLVMIAFSYCFRAVGDFITPTKLFATSLVLNLALDPLLIFGLGPVPALGLVGAAIATLIAQSIAVLIYAWRIVAPHGGHVLVLRRPFTLNWRLMGRIARIGSPSGLQYVLFSAMMMITYRYLAGFGAAATAAVGIGLRFTQSAVMPGIAIGAAVASLTGQSWGARQPARIKAGIVWGLIYTVGLGAAEYALLAAAPRFWVSLFASDPEIVHLGALNLLICGAFLVPNAIGIVTTFASQGLGRTYAPMLAVAVRLACFVLFLNLLERSGDLSVVAIYWATIAAFVADSLVMTAVLTIFWTRVLRTPVAVPAAAHPAAGGD